VVHSPSLPFFFLFLYPSRPSFSRGLLSRSVFLTAGFSLPRPLMQIQALLFKELSTHNPMDGSIFGELRKHTHTHTHTRLYMQKASHTLSGIQGHVVSLINTRIIWHIHTHARTDTHSWAYTQAERSPFSAAMVLYFEQPVL